MKRGVIVFAVFLLVFSVGTFAQTANSEISGDVKTYVEGFLEKGGIEKEAVKDIKEINQAELPDEVEIKEIDENKVGIYEVNYSKDSQDKKLFVVTYSTNKLPEKTISKNLQYLNFGLSINKNESGYLDTSTGVNSENGYVMLHEGSVTGISSSLNLENDGSVEIKVYKNGVDTGFSNFVASEDDEYIDYDTQSENVVNFVPGDRISVYVEVKGDVSFEDVVTLVEITV